MVYVFLIVEIHGVLGTHSAMARGALYGTLLTPDELGTSRASRCAELMGFGADAASGLRPRHDAGLQEIENLQQPNWWGRNLGKVVEVLFRA